MYKQEYITRNVQHTVTQLLQYSVNISFQIGQCRHNLHGFMVLVVVC